MRFSPAASSSLFVASFVTSALALAIGFEGRAEACSPPAHRETIASPVGGGTVPASAPGLVFSGEEGVTPTLLDGTGTAVAGTVKTDRYWRYFAPSAALAPGSYTLTYPTYTSSPTTEQTAITVTAAVALPSQTGTLSVAGTDRKDTTVPTSSGSCVEDADIAIVDLALAMDPSLTPYASAVVWKTTVDGKGWSETQKTASLANASEYAGTLRLYTACDTAGTNGRFNGVTPGAHNIEIQPLLIGSTATIAPATLRVVVSCGSDNGTIILPPEGSGDPSGDPPKGNGSPAATTEPGDSSAAPSDASDSSSGCSTSPARHAGSSLASMIGLAGVVALAIRSRRRVSPNR